MARTTLRLPAVIVPATVPPSHRPILHLHRPTPHLHRPTLHPLPSHLGSLHRPTLHQIETLAPPRGEDSSAEGTLDRLLSLLLVELDGVQAATGPPVLLLAACVSPSQLDPAILRPGRLDMHVAVCVPDEAQRLALLGQMLSRSPVDAQQVSLPQLAGRTAGFSLAQISALCREAAMCALREDLECATIGSRHIDAAVATALRT